MTDYDWHIHDVCDHCNTIWLIYTCVCDHYDSMTDTYMTSVTTATQSDWYIPVSVTTMTEYDWHIHDVCGHCNTIWLIYTCVCDHHDRVWLTHTWRLWPPQQNLTDIYLCLWPLWHNMTDIYTCVCDHYGNMTDIYTPVSYIIYICGQTSFIRTAWCPLKCVWIVKLADYWIIVNRKW